jgi:hypothetical protein
MEEQCSARITWDVLVSSLHFGCRGCILDEGWAALDSARHRGDQRESDRGSEHRLESRSIAEGRQKDARRKAREPVLCLGADVELLCGKRNPRASLENCKILGDETQIYISATRIACGRLLATSPLSTHKQAERAQERILNRR